MNQKQDKDAAVEAFSEGLQKKLRGEKAAKEVIFGAAERWTGFEHCEREGFPIVRSGKVLGYFGGQRTILGGTPEVSNVTGAIWKEDTPVLKRRKKGFESIRRKVDALTKALGDLPVEEQTQIYSLNTDEAWRKGKESARDIVGALGARQATVLGCELLKIELSEAIERCDAELETRKKRRGRPRSEDRYHAAEGLAKIYARVTGERPTYSEDANGIYGSFTPVLRDLFDAFGWEKAELKGPAAAAIKNITEDDLDPGLNALNKPFPPLWHLLRRG